MRSWVVSLEPLARLLHLRRYCCYDSGSYWKYDSSLAGWGASSGRRSVRCRWGRVSCQFASCWPVLSLMILPFAGPNVRGRGGKSASSWLLVNQLPTSTSVMSHCCCQKMMRNRWMSVQGTMPWRNPVSTQSLQSLLANEYVCGMPSNKASQLTKQKIVYFSSYF